MNSAKTAIAMAFTSERPDFNWVSLFRFILASFQSGWLLNENPSVLSLEVGSCLPSLEHFYLFLDAGLKRCTGLTAMSSLTEVAERAFRVRSAVYLTRGW